MPPTTLNSEEPVNPLPNGAPVAFANETMNKPLPGYLGLSTLSPGRAPKN